MSVEEVVGWIQVIIPSLYIVVIVAFAYLAIKYPRADLAEHNVNMAPFRNIFITGASRGIGFGLVKHLLETFPDVRVIATARDLTTATQLTELSTTYSKDRLVLVQLDTTSADSYKSASADLAAAGVTTIDVLIANAGIGARYDTLSCPAADALEVYNTNVVGSMLTVQSFHGLLGGAKLVVFISSIMGSIEKTIEMRGGAMAYRASKAALNMLAVSYGEEQARDGVKVLAVHPGWVQTDMGNSAGPAPVTVPQSVEGIAHLLVTAAQVQTKELGDIPPAYLALRERVNKENCVFVDYTGAFLPW